MTTEPVVLARGELISHEHTTIGSVTVLGLPDGSRVLRLAEGSAGWRVVDDGRHVDLGDLKGNIDSSNYPIPGRGGPHGAAQREHLVRAVQRLLRCGGP